MKSAPDKQIKGNEKNLSNKFEHPPYELYDMPYREVINEIAKSYPYGIYFFLWRVYCNDKDRKFKFPYIITAQSWNKFQTKLSNIKVGKKKYSLLIPIDFEKAKHLHFNMAGESSLDKDGQKIFKSLERYGFWNLILQIPKEILRDPEKFNLYFVQNFKFFPSSSHGRVTRESKFVINGNKKPVKEDNNNFELKISTTKTKSTYHLAIKCGFCRKEHDYYIEKRNVNEIEPKGYGIINREESDRILEFKIDFNNWDFEIAIDNYDINQLLDLDLIESGKNTIMVLTNSKKYLIYKTISKPKKEETHSKRKNTHPVTVITQKPKKLNQIRERRGGTQIKMVTTANVEKLRTILKQRSEDIFSGNLISRNGNKKKSTRFREKLLEEQKNKEKMEEREKKLKEEEKQLKDERYKKKRQKINKENQKRVKKIEQIYRKALTEEVNDCLELGCKELMENKVRERLDQKFSPFLDSYQYHEDDYVNYLLGFKKYRKEHLSKDLKKLNNFLKKVHENKNIPESFEDSKGISETKLENIEDIRPSRKCTDLVRYMIAIRYFLFLILVLLFFYFLILGGVGIYNAPYPPSAAANSFKWICILVYVICSVFISGYLIPIIYLKFCRNS